MTIERYLSAGVGETKTKKQAPKFAGKWKNRLHSEMELAVDTDGDVSGKYRTGVGAPQPTEEFDLRASSPVT